jgi:hypothetical protein
MFKDQLKSYLKELTGKDYQVKPVLCFSKAFVQLRHAVKGVAKINVKFFNTLLQRQKPQLSIAQGETIPTVAMTTSLGFHASVSEDVVYAITSVICDFAEQVRQIHPAAHYFNPSRACLQGRGLLHLGGRSLFSGHPRQPV